MIMKKKYLKKICASVVVGLLLLTGCGKEPESNPTANENALSQEESINYMEEEKRRSGTVFKSACCLVRPKGYRDERDRYRKKPV